MPPRRHSFRRNRVAPIEASILSSSGHRCAGTRLYGYMAMPDISEFLVLRRRQGCSAAADEARDAIEEPGIVHDVKKPAATVLAAVAFWPRKRALLVHVPEDGISMSMSRRSTRGYSNLCVIALWFGHALEPDGFAFPRARRGDYDGSWLTQGRIPAANGGIPIGCGDFRFCPPGCGQQWFAAQHRRDHLPGRHI
jgi:hypothetical protein